MDYQTRILPTRDLLLRMPHKGAGKADIESIDLMLNLVAATDHLRAVTFEPMLREHGISEGKFSLLMAVFGEGELTSKRLSERMGVQPATVSVMVKRMLREAAPLISVQPGDGDKRERRIRLTDAGRATVERLLPGHLRILRGFGARFTDAERETFITLLKKLHGH